MIQGSPMNSPISALLSKVKLHRAFSSGTAILVQLAFLPLVHGSGHTAVNSWGFGGVSVLTGRDFGLTETCTGTASSGSWHEVVVLQGLFIQPTVILYLFIKDHPGYL